MEITLKTKSLMTPWESNKVSNKLDENVWHKILRPIFQPSAIENPATISLALHLSHFIDCHLEHPIP